jgi:hypothetical protein
VVEGTFVSHDFRLDPDDEFPHPVDPAPDFNESVYVNAFDHRLGLGGWARVGNRVNEGHAETAVCLYLPGGRLACQFLRPEITTNEAFAAGGLRYEVIDPLHQVEMHYRGQLSVLDDPTALHQPREALERAPRVDAEVVWTFSGVSPVHGGEPTGPATETMYGRDFARGHFNQHGSVSGRIRVGEESWPIEGFGWRDHSWGPRSWQAIRWYRLLLGNIPPADGLMVLQIATPGTSSPRAAGVVLRDGRYHAVEALTLETTWSGVEPAALRAEVKTSTGVEVITGEVLTVAPLRNRRKGDDGPVYTRIAEAFTRWSWDGRAGYGMAEVLDLVERGRPVGVPVGTAG